MKQYVEEFLKCWPGNDGRVAVFQTLLKEFTPGRVIDLGTGHGIFARLAADSGWDVVAVDARMDRWSPEDDRVQWIQQDVRETDVSGYDLILCLGLFYHLTLDDQRDLLSRCFPTSLILETHLADNPVGSMHGESGSTDILGSWGNEQSHWPSVGLLIEILHETGYMNVREIRPWVWPDRTFFVVEAS